MRKVLSVLLWVCLVTVVVYAAMAVASRVDEDGAGSSATVTSPAQSHTAGRQLVAFTTHFLDADQPAITNTAGDSWSLAGTITSANVNYWAFYTCSTIGHATDQVTATYAGAQILTHISVYELSGGATSSCLDDVDTASGNSTDVATPSLTVTNGDSIIILFAVCDGTGFTAFDGNWTTPTVLGGFFADSSRSSAASTAAVMTCGTGPWVAIAVAMKAPAAGGGSHDPTGLLGVIR